MQKTENGLTSAAWRIM